jgi:TIR domain-containing protein
MSDNELETWDLFISHASEDKEAFVRPLALALERFGIRVWYDEYTLNLGDSLSRSVDKGLANSDYGVVVLSPAFIAKKWPEYELRGLTAREMSGTKIILPVWHNITHEEILRFSPPLADKLAVRSDQSTPIQIAIKIIKAVRPELFTRILRRIAHYKFIDTATVEKKPLSALKPSPIQHEVLPPELTSRIRLIRASLLDVDAHSMSHWIDGFKRDSHPSTEIAFWERVASVYLEYSRMIQPMSNEQKQQIYTFISSIWLSSTGAELIERARGLPEGAMETIMSLYSQSEPSYDIEEESPFPDIEPVAENRHDRKQYDTEHFPKDFPEDLIRDLMKLEATQPGPV